MQEKSQKNWDISTEKQLLKELISPITPQTPIIPNRPPLFSDI
jgi:hypothetical protein